MIQIQPGTVYSLPFMASRVSGAGRGSLLRARPFWRPSWPRRNLKINSLSQNGVFTWSDPGGSGNHYAIQWAPTVNGPWTNWLDSANNFTGLGATGSVTVPMFYRMVVPDTNGP